MHIQTTLAFVVAAALCGQALAADMSKSAYIDHWTHTCKMAVVDRHVNLPPKEMAVMQEDLPEIEGLKAGMHAFYDTMKEAGAKVPS
jgi:hypothetical protein